MFDTIRGAQCAPLPVRWPVGSSPWRSCLLPGRTLWSGLRAWRRPGSCRRMRWCCSKDGRQSAVPTGRMRRGRQGTVPAGRKRSPNPMHAGCGTSSTSTGWTLWTTGICWGGWIGASPCFCWEPPWIGRCPGKGPSCSASAAKSSTVRKIWPPCWSADPDVSLDSGAFLPFFLLTFSIQSV